MVKPINDKRYNFLMVKLLIRWVDYERIRSVFPSERGESAASYFRRLGLWLKKTGVLLK